MNSAVPNPNVTLLRIALEKLAPLLDRIAFVGGCATGLLITDAGAAAVRPTIDVDVIVEVASYPEFTQLEQQLRQLGLRESHSEDAPICRWVSDKLIVDITPTDPAILHFGNRWYRPAFARAVMTELGGFKFRLISAPYFVATKLEAFHGRGKNDYRMSHDMEDIVTVVDGRHEIVADVGQSEITLRQFLRTEFSALLKERNFLEALPGHLLPDRASQQRLPIVIERFRQIASP